LLKSRRHDTHIHDLISEYPGARSRPHEEGQLPGLDAPGGDSPTADPIRVMKYYRLLWETMRRETLLGGTGILPVFLLASC